MARSRPRNEAVYAASYARERSRGNSEAYSKRIASAEARGISKQRARGHVAREHVVRQQRAVSSGRLTETEKRWLKQQMTRINYTGASEAGKARWAEAVKAFTEMTPEERWQVRVAQQARQKNTGYASVYAPMYGDRLTPMYLSSRSGLR